MPKLTVDGVGEFEVPAGRRLVLALEEEAGVDVLHACGGNARCTTCRVEFIAGEPDKMTAAEKNLLAAQGTVRCSAQLPDCLRSRHGRAGHQPVGWQRPQRRRPQAHAGNCPATGRVDDEVSRPRRLPAERVHNRPHDAIMSWCRIWLEVSRNGRKSPGLRPGLGSFRTGMGTW